jgi:hypothetical protein
MIVSLIDSAPVLKPRDFFQLSMFLTPVGTATPHYKSPLYAFGIVSGRPSCIKFEYNFGEEWFDTAELPEVHFLVEGEFENRYMYQYGLPTAFNRQNITPQTLNVYPMPVAQKLHGVFPTKIRGKMVLAVLSRAMEDLVFSFYKTHRVRDWILDKGWLAYRPKDYVTEMHLDNETWSHGYYDGAGKFIEGMWKCCQWNSDPGCDCCSAEITTGRRAGRNQMEWDISSEWDVDEVLNRHGAERVARFFHPPGHFILSLPPSPDRKRLFLENIAWRRRRDLVQTAGLFSKTIAAPIDPEEHLLLLGGRITIVPPIYPKDCEDKLLLDGRMTGATMTKRLRSFVTGSVVLFL